MTKCSTSVASREIQNRGRYHFTPIQFSSVQSLRHVRLLGTPWITARQVSLSITNSRSSPRLMSIKSVMPSSHLILCHPLLLLPPISHSIRVFSNDLILHMRWPKYWNFSFSIIPSKEIPGLIPAPYLIHRRRQWQPTPVLLPGKSHGRRSLVGCLLWGRTELEMTEAI